MFSVIRTFTYAIHATACFLLFPNNLFGMIFGSMQLCNGFMSLTADPIFRLERISWVIYLTHHLTHEWPIKTILDLSIPNWMATIHQFILRLQSHVLRRYFNPLLLYFIIKQNDSSLWSRSNWVKLDGLNWEIHVWTWPFSRLKVVWKNGWSRNQNFQRPLSRPSTLIGLDHSHNGFLVITWFVANSPVLWTRMINTPVITWLIFASF